MSKQRFDITRDAAYRSGCADTSTEPTPVA